MAFEDAMVLCELLGDGGAIDAALARFEARRRERVARVQRASRERMEANRVRGPHACAVRDRLLREIGARLLEEAWAPLMTPEGRA
jgi:2-polyprenyl-6-methoxyphenol hydroxylase-like FAD-dependent oxidoreductase